ncbi:MAG: ABC transporter substrate-binding protein [Methylophilaceae bacterium]
MLKYFLLLLIALSSLACQRDASHQEINFAIAQAPLNLDPRYATDAASERVNRLLYQSLMDFDAASKPVPILASKIEVNGLEYRITLKKPRSPFHYLAPLNAADVVATYQSILKLKDSPHIAEFKNVARIEAPDNDTVLFTLRQADAHFLAKLIIGILPKSLIDQGHDFSHSPVGSGPLKFVSWQNKLTLQRLKDGQKISLQEVKDPTVRVLKLLRGEADLLQGDLSPELVKYLQTRQEIRVSASVGANFSYLGLNMQDPVLKQLRVRQAIAHAIDAQAIIDKVMVQNSRVAGAILPPEHYAGNAHLTPYGYNPELSKKRLYETGVKLPLKLVYKTSTDAQRIRFATILQAQMRPAGIELEIRSLDWGTFFEDVKQGKFQVFGLTWVGIKTPEIYAKAFGSQSFPPNGFNRGKYADAELDAQLAKEDWPAATARIHAQLPYIPLWYEGQFAAMRKNIQYYSPRPDGNWDDLMSIKRSVQ